MCLGAFNTASLCPESWGIIRGDRHTQYMIHLEKLLKWIILLFYFFSFSEATRSIWRRVKCTWTQYASFQINTHFTQRVFLLCNLDVLSCSDEASFCLCTCQRNPSSLLVSKLSLHLQLQPTDSNATYRYCSQPGSNAGSPTYYQHFIKTVSTMCPLMWKLVPSSKHALKMNDYSMSGQKPTMENNLDFLQLLLWILSPTL